MEALDLLDPAAESYDVIINVQGDEPLIQAQDINYLLQLFEEGDVDVATLIAEIKTEEDYLDPNVVKAVPSLFEDEFCDINYFSRSPIPHMSSFEQGMAFKHIGVYAFSNTALQEIREMPPSPLEAAEKLEQLRWLQNHMLISAVLCDHPLIGVDSPEDLQAVENFLTSKNQ